MIGNVLQRMTGDRRHDPRRAPGLPGGRLAVVLFLLLAQACTTTSTEPLPVLPGVDSRFLEDPVFGGRVHLYEAGDPDAPTVVLVHGIDDRGAESWAGLIEDLRGDYHVLAFDLPGFGHSSRGSHLYSPDRYVAALRYALDEVHDGPVHLVGHSLGGAVSLRYAARYPDEVEHLYLVSVAGILHKASYTGFLARLGQAEDARDQDHADSLLDRFGGRLLRKFFRKIAGGHNLSATERGRQGALGGDPLRIAAVALVETDFSRTLAGMPVPTSVFWGEDDTVAPLRTGRLLAARLPGRDLVVFPEAGHAPMTQAHDAFNEQLLARLEGDERVAGGWPPPPATPGERVGRCQDGGDMTMTGRYDRIVIERCRRVTLDRVTARYIEIRESRVTLREPRILGDEVGVRVSHSDLTITAGEIVADTAIDISQTFLDVAGTHLLGHATAIRGTEGGASELTFSVTPVESDGELQYLHGIRAHRAGDTL